MASGAAASRLRAGPFRLLASVSRLHIVAIAATAALTLGWALTGKMLVGAAVLCALDWFAVNILNRVVDLEEDRANGIVGTAFVASHRRAIVVGGWGLVGVSLLATAPLWPLLTSLRLGYHALGAVYNWPILPGSRRLKATYGLKNLASGMGFVITCFGYPLAQGSAALLPDVTPITLLLVATWFLAFELSYEVVYDLRDVDGDRLAGARTFPVVHGTRVAVHIIDVLLTISLAALVAGYGLGLVPWRMFVMGVAPVLQWVAVKRWLRRGIGAADCVHLTWLGVALLAIYQIWVALALPGV